MMLSLFSWLFILLLAIIFFEINVVLVSGHCPRDQQWFLLQLKNRLDFNSSSSLKLVKWNQSTDCCTWEGVTCDAEGHVTDLELSNEWTVRGIDNSSSIFNLQHLQSLNLANNHFNSDFPSRPFESPKFFFVYLRPLWQQIARSTTKPLAKFGICRLLEQQFQLYYTILRYLNYLFFHPSFQQQPPGSIPESICHVTNLQVLDLSNNSLNGTIPQCLNEMESLKVLDLSRNNLSGNISVKFSSDCSLLTLNVNGNHLEGKVPRSLANCAILEVLDLGNNQISDTFPCHLKYMSNLKVLVLRYNNFHGLINCLDDNSSWPPLQIVAFASNHFREELPYHWLQSWEAVMVALDVHKVLVFEEDIHLEFEINKSSQTVCLPESEGTCKDGGRTVTIISIDFFQGIVILPLMLRKRLRVWYYRHTDGLLSKFFSRLNQGSRNRGR
ncbi:hypothetical protein SLEP1_g31942 [Rubroshorea leprosula]|uniref:Leucine-rich repeat-containing N-terminal plant-type domain-containing protein n=1 Tax=Rubroshorea leprosula TaxID=152421 RepID=A0AAV5KBS1_9ROSI|nr:hypothetical protein SLEP1_g31942 [Rubroshorea leprosula]